MLVVEHHRVYGKFMCQISYSNLAVETICFLIWQLSLYLVLCNFECYFQFCSQLSRLYSIRWHLIYVNSDVFGNGWIQWNIYRGIVSWVEHVVILIQHTVYRRTNVALQKGQIETSMKPKEKNCGKLLC